MNATYSDSYNFHVHVREHGQTQCWRDLQALLFTFTSCKLFTLSKNTIVTPREREQNGMYALIDAAFRVFTPVNIEHEILN